MEILLGLILLLLAVCAISYFIKLFFPKQWEEHQKRGKENREAAWGLVADVISRVFGKK